MSTGQSSPHESAHGHVTGSARYVDDIPVPAATLHVATGHIAVAHGQITQLDLEQVRDHADVVDVVCVEDIPGDPDIGAVAPGDPLLTSSTLSYAHQPIFAVAAHTFRAAQQAARLARIETTRSEPILTLDRARQLGERVLPDRDFGSPFEPQAPNYVEGAIDIGGQEHFYVEGQVALALPLDAGRLHVYASTQHPDEIQHAVAHVLGLSMHQVIIECPRMGGAFGGKETQGAQAACLAALIACRTGKPAKCRLPRHDDMHQTGKRHPFQWRYRIGFDDDARLSEAAIEVHANCGHSPDLSGPVVQRAMFHATNAYHVPRAHIRGRHWRTHLASNTAFRGFGGPQGMLGIEAALDEIAFARGLDPLEVRKRNLYRPGHDQTPYGQQVEQFVLADLIEQLEISSDYQRRLVEIAAFNRDQHATVRALALTPVQFGISFTLTHLNQAGALVHLYRDGTAMVSHGGTEMGQGLNTKIRQVAATELGLPPEDIVLTSARTDLVPNASATAASSGTDLNGMAVRAACIELKQRIATALESQSLEFSNGRVRSDQIDLSFAEAVDAAWRARVSLSATGYYSTPDVHFDFEAGTGRPFYYFANGAAASEVEVDRRTGEYRVTRVDILHDVGDSLNPDIDRGQIEGGFIQGMGWLTREELSWTTDGVLASAGPASYKIPVAGDTPPAFNVDFYRQPNSVPTIYRSKAVGEPPLMLAFSVWCALRAACAATGNQLPRLSVPATPEAVYWAMEEAQGRPVEDRG